MNLVSFEQIALAAGVSLRTVARDVQRRLLIPYKQGRKALIDLEATATAKYIASRQATQRGDPSTGEARVSRRGQRLDHLQEGISFAP
jgi:hypothetical protein